MASYIRPPEAWEIVFGPKGNTAGIPVQTDQGYATQVFRPKPYVPIIDRLEVMQIEESLAEPGMISEQEFDEMVNFAPDNMTPTQRCRSAKARLLTSRKSDKERAIIDLVDEYMRNQSTTVYLMCDAKQHGSKMILQDYRDQLTKGAIKYVREKKAGIPILGGIIWFFIRGLVARIVADYISDLLFSAGE